MPEDAVPTRRERLRAEALADIRRHGYAQIAEGGPTALSLSGIAKAMGMSGPAMYRYFASRDDLLVTLVTESYEDLAAALTAAAQEASGRDPADRLRAAARAYRAWAVAQPHRYRLAFGSTYGSGALDPDRIVSAAQRSMSISLAALADLGPADAAPVVTDERLRREVVAWADAAGEPPLAPAVLLLGLLAWSRMHGLVSLEIEGALGQTGVDPARLFDAELDLLIAERTGEARGR